MYITISNFLHLSFHTFQLIFAISFIEVETEKIWSKLEHERELEGLAGSEVVVGVVLLLKAIERLLEKTEF